MPFAQDGTITWELIIERINSDLANVFGNLVNRTVAMTNKYFGGQLTKPVKEYPEDEDLKQFVLNTVKTVDQKMDELRVGDALEAIIDLFRRCNKYIDETTPWALAKDETNKERLNSVLYNLIEGIRIGSVLLEPFMPETAQKVYVQLNTKVTDYDSLLTFGNYECSKVTETPVPLFARLDPVKTMDEVHAYLGKPEEKLEHKEQITIDDFDKMEIRVAKVLSCEKHPKADKLLVFKVKMGPEERTIVSGIAKWYKPEQLVGKKVLVVANLKPVTLRGIESQGMILSAEDDEDNLEVVSVDAIKDGAEVH
jgi:methionyl-tRNA synthetase